MISVETVGQRLHHLSPGFLTEGISKIERLAQGTAFQFGRHLLQRLPLFGKRQQLEAMALRLTGVTDQLTLEQVCQRPVCRLLADTQRRRQIADVDLIGTGDDVQDAVMNAGQPLGFEKLVRLYRQPAKTKVQQLKRMVERVQRFHVYGSRIDFLLYDHGAFTQLNCGEA